MLAVFSRSPRPTALTSENCGFLLFVQPPEELLKPRVGQDNFYRIEGLPKVVVTPGLVNEILARVARRHDLGSAFAARNHMMSTRWGLPLTKHARLGHKSFAANIANQCSTENGGRSGNRTHDRLTLHGGRPPSQSVPVGIDPARLPM